MSELTKYSILYNAKILYNSLNVQFKSETTYSIPVEQLKLILLKTFFILLHNLQTLNYFQSA